eukprot:GFUD01043276.1.p1 GENE.GFUD01043276.1~~GFUD01043276.1.p1  ORF type:complete len:217 (-),score=40.83 GFUD01043276.1:229-879(-)
MAAYIDNFLNSFNIKFDRNVRRYMKNVYTSLTMSVVATSVGAYVCLFTSLLQGGLISLGSGLVLGFFMTPDNGNSLGKQMGMLLGFAFLTGLGLSHLLQMDPALVPSDLVITSAVFACFTGAALYAPDGQYLNLGDTCMSELSTILFLELLIIFFKSQLLIRAHRYIGLAFFCRCIMRTTQVIVRKARARNGDRYFIEYSLDLFIIFVAFLVILRE